MYYSAGESNNAIVVLLYMLGSAGMHISTYRLKLDF